MVVQPIYYYRFHIYIIFSVSGFCILYIIKQKGKVYYNNNKYDIITFKVLCCLLINEIDLITM